MSTVSDEGFRLRAQKLRTGKLGVFGLRQLEPMAIRFSFLCCRYGVAIAGISPV